MSEVCGFIVDIFRPGDREFWPLFGPVRIVLHPNRRHAECMRGHKVAGDILEHGGFGGIYAGMDEDIVDRPPEVGLGENRMVRMSQISSKNSCQPGAGENALGVMAAAIGEDEALAGQRGNDFGQGRDRP